VVPIIRVKPEALASDALGLADAQLPIAPPLAVPPAADPVSQRNRQPISLMRAFRWPRDGGTRSETARPGSAPLGVPQPPPRRNYGHTR
jgi:hypothetical protein